MAETEGLEGLEGALGWQANRERGRGQLDGISEPTLVVHQLLHPRAHVGGGDVDEHEGGCTRIEPLLLEQVGFGAGSVEHGNDGLAVVDHVAVEFHHLAFLSWTEQQQGHARGVRVPNFAPASGGFVHELTDGHVRNHGGYSHLGTRNEEVVPTFYPTGEVQWTASIPWRRRVLPEEPRPRPHLSGCCD